MYVPDDEQYVAEEARLMEQLREIRRWREEFGMATRGGVVQVAEEERAEGEPPRETPAEPLTGRIQLDVSVDFGDEGDPA